MNYNDYTFSKLPVENYNYKTDEIHFRRTLLYRTVVIERDKSISVTVFDKNYKLIDSYEERWDHKYETSFRRLCETIFPFSIKLFDKNSTYLKLNMITNFGLGSVIVNIFCMVLFLLIFRKNTHTGEKLLTSILIACTGLYGLATVLFIKD